MQVRVFWTVSLCLVIGGCYKPYPAPQQGPTDFSNHAAFPIDRGAHDGLDCNTCHGAFTTFTQFSCTSCHAHDESAMASVHQGVTDYLWADGSCYACHPTGEGISRAQHTRFPIVTGNHASVGCAECHPQGYSSVSCFDCHTHTCATVSPSHASVAGFACDSALCVQCHPQGETMSRSQHTDFPIVSGNHAAVACAECHPQGYDAIACFDCHSHTCAATTPRHDEVSNFSCDSQRCYQCHPSGVAQD